MADNVVYSGQPKLFTLKGMVAVHFTDGQILEGEFLTQDAFNIFLTIDGEPAMIPRQQIRLIKGAAGQSVEADLSPDQFAETPAAEAKAIAPPPLPAVDSTETTAEIAAVSQPGQLATAAYASQPESESAETEAEEQGPLILMPGAEEEAEEAGTVILPTSQAQALAEAEADDDEFSTLVLETEEQTPALGVPLMEDEAGDETFDMTVVLDDSDELFPEFAEDREEPTLTLGGKEDKAPARLTCTSGPHSGEVFEVKSGITTIGRASDNMIALSGDKEISRRHAIIGYDAGAYLVQDQNSLNGTFVNDSLLTGPRELHDGDVILVGISHLKFET